MNWTLPAELRPRMARAGHILLAIGSGIASLGAEVLKQQNEELTGQVKALRDGHRAVAERAFSLGRMHEASGFATPDDVLQMVLDSLTATAEEESAVRVDEPGAAVDEREHQGDEPGAAVQEREHQGDEPGAYNLRPVALMAPDGSDTGRTIWERVPVDEPGAVVYEHAAAVDDPGQAGLAPPFIVPGTLRTRGPLEEPAGQLVDGDGGR